MGQKPLVYRDDPRRLLFASELKALLQVPGASRELDPVALDGFLTYQYVPHPRTMLAGYRKLPPAHKAVYQDGRLTLERYWRPGYEEPILARSREEWQETLRETLTEAVRLRAYVLGVRVKNDRYRAEETLLPGGGLARVCPGDSEPARLRRPLRLDRRRVNRGEP